MAFAQKTWKDRVAEYINRRILTKEDGNTELVSVERSEGTISQEGDAFSAENMNDLEQRIANEFSEQNKKIPFSFGIDGDGNYGYYGADDSLIPFNHIDSNVVEEIGFTCFVSGYSNSRQGLIANGVCVNQRWDSEIDGTFLKLSSAQISAKQSGYYLAFNEVYSSEGVFRYYEKDELIAEKGTCVVIKFKD